MEYKILKYLYDVDKAIFEIEEIQEHDANESPTIDLMRIRALERNFEIIGEAINRILKEDQSYIAKITSSRAIVDLRNFIIHSYEKISTEIIFDIINEDVPLLKSEVKKLIIDLPHPPGFKKDTKN